MINILFPDQIEELRALERSIAAMPDFESAGRLLVTRLATIVDAPAILLDTQRGSWRIVAQAGDLPPIQVLVSAVQSARPSEGEQEQAVFELTVPDRGPWMCLALRKRDKGPLLLLFGGNWALS